MMSENDILIELAERIKNGEITLDNLDIKWQEKVIILLEN